MTETNTTRPTVDEIMETVSHALMFSDLTTDDLLAAFTSHGYVIVHPDDVPERPVEWKMCDYPNGINEGWNDCRAHIFGDDT